MKCSLESPTIKNDILGDARTGLWCIEFDEGAPARLFADATFCEMMGMDECLTPEDAYLFWNERICESDRARVDVLADEMGTGRHCEAEYAWRHPALGVIDVRCGGRRDPSYTKGVRLRGSHQVITDIVRVRRSIEGRLGADLVQRCAPSDIEGLRDAMMHVLCEDYVSIYYYDLAKRAFTPYLLDDWARETWQVAEGQWYPYHVMRLYVENFVDDRFKEELRPFTDADYVIQMLKKSATHTVIMRYRCMYGGEEHYFYWKICAVYSRGAMTGFAVAFCLNDEEVGREVQRRQLLDDALERAERAGRARTEFLGGMSHNIRTPLNAVRGFADLAQRRIGDESAVRDCLEKIRASSDLLLQIVDDLFRSAGAEDGGSGHPGDLADADAGLPGAAGEGAFRPVEAACSIDVPCLGNLSQTDDLPHAGDGLPPAGLAGRRMLLVEDNELNRELVRDLLERWGVEVDEARNGALAVERMRFSDAGHYDLVIMDIQMPVMGGLEATRAIRSLPGRDAASLPIVAMTANAIETDRDAALTCGMNDFVSKPIDAGVLLQALRRALHI